MPVYTKAQKLYLNPKVESMDVDMLFDNVTGSLLIEHDTPTSYH